MGSVLSNFHDYKTGFGPDLTSPLKSDWITLHAELTGISIVEIERLWRRFKLLGCGRTGYIEDEYIISQSDYKNDTLFKNILLSLSIDEKVYFHTFVNAMKWVDKASANEKSHAIYSFFNSGMTINEQLFAKLLKHVYPEKNEQTRARYADIVFREIASARRGLTFDDFMKFCGGNTDNLAAIVDFSVIPHDIIAEAHGKFASVYASDSDKRDKDRTGSTLVSIDSFKELAARLANTDWKPIVYELGFSATQIDSLTSNLEHDEEKALHKPALITPNHINRKKPIQLTKLFTKWSDTNGEEANCEAMRSALNQTRPDLTHTVYGDVKE